MGGLNNLSYLSDYNSDGHPDIIMYDYDGGYTIKVYDPLNNYNELFNYELGGDEQVFEADGYGIWFANLNGDAQKEIILAMDNNQYLMVVDGSNNTRIELVCDISILILIPNFFL